MPAQEVWSMDEWSLHERRAREAALSSRSEQAAWRVMRAYTIDGGNYYGVPLVNFAGWFLTALVACRAAGAAPRENFWAGLVGSAVMLFFALLALAHSLPYVALVGFGLCLARPALALVTRRASRRRGRTPLS
jgi:uncharacterized membrane protein